MVKEGNRRMEEIDLKYVEAQAKIDSDVDKYEKDAKATFDHIQRERSESEHCERSERSEHGEPEQPLRIKTCRTHVVGTGINMF